MSHEVQAGDKFVLNSENGKRYIVTVKNVNDYRPPDMKYAVDVIDSQDNSYYKEYGDFWFCGDDFLGDCERIRGDSDE